MVSIVPIPTIQFYPKRSASRTRVLELGFSEEAVGDLTQSATTSRSSFSSIAAIRQYVLAVGIPNARRCTLSLHIRKFCWRLPAMNQAVIFNWHVFRFSICGPIGPLNNG
jgi:hypothetical protein